MKQSIIMPALSPSMEQGTLVRWLVQEGVEFKAGEALAEIETDKAVLPLEAPADGRIARILVRDGTEGVRVGCPLADLDQRGPAEPDKAIPPTTQVAVESDKDLRVEDPPDGQPERSQLRILASPSARRLAEELGLELASIRGSGPGGRVLGSDVTRTKNTAAGPDTPSSRSERVRSALANSGSGSPDCQEVPLTPMRRAIAERMLASKQMIPHAYLTVDLNMDALIRLREEVNQNREGEEGKYSLNDFMVRAMALALAQSPKVNVQFLGDHLMKFRKVDLAVAVSVEDGLMTPVIRNASEKRLRDIFSEMRDLSARAKERRLRPEEYSGGSACLSNLGMMDVKQFEAIINPPQSIILAVGAVEKRAAVIDDKLTVVKQLTATASFDHRAMDGRDCAEFLGRLRAIVEGSVKDLL